MKQILFLVVLALVGYLVLWGGTTNVLHRADINPKKLISNLASGVDENFLPEIDPTRTGFKYTNPNSYQQIKDNILMTYDPDICFALVDMVYSSGSNDSEPLIRKYLEMFTLPEDSAKVLNLLSIYKDKQTGRILMSLYNDSDISKPALLNMLAEYHTPDVAKVIKAATVSEDLVLAQAAQALVDTVGEKRWYTEGLKAPAGSSSFDLDLSFNKNHLGQQYHKGSDFENKMNQY